MSFTDQWKDESDEADSSWVGEGTPGAEAHTVGTLNALQNGSLIEVKDAFLLPLI